MEKTLDDIVIRLRRDSKWTEGLTDQQIEEMCNEAADEIEMLRRVEHEAAEWVEEQTKRLRADNARLRAALDEINMASFPLERESVRVSCVPIGAWDNAMRALESK